MSTTQSVSKVENAALDMSGLPPELSVQQTPRHISEILKLEDNKQITFHYGDYIPNAVAFNQYLEANIKPGSSKRISKKNCIKLIKAMANTMNSGGLSAMPMLCLDKDCARYKECPIVLAGQAAPKGEHCQPPGQKVLTVEGYKAIEDLQEGFDRVITYAYKDSSIGGKGIKKRGRKFTLHSRKYEGPVITFKSSTGEYSCTYNHQVIARWSDKAKDKYIVYLMQKGEDFRVGKVQLFRTTGPKVYSRLAARVSRENAEKAWILGVADTNTEALLLEEQMSIKHGIPKSCFVATSTRDKESIPYDGLNKWVTQEQINLHFEKCRKPLCHWDSVLNSEGLSIKYPLIDKTERPKFNMSFSYASTIAACNVIGDLMEMKAVDREFGITWEPVTKATVWYSGEVYSLDVEKEHTYISGNLVTHNCPVERTEILNHMRSLSLDVGPDRSYADQLTMGTIARIEIMKGRLGAELATDSSPMVDVVKGVDPRTGEKIMGKEENPLFKMISTLSKEEQVLFKSLHATQEQKQKRKQEEVNKSGDVAVAALKEKLQELMRNNGTKGLETLDVDAVPVEEDPTPLKEDLDESTEQPEQTPSVHAELNDGGRPEGEPVADGDEDAVQSTSVEDVARNVESALGGLSSSDGDFRGARNAKSGRGNKPYFGKSPFKGRGKEGGDSDTGSDASSMEEAE